MYALIAANVASAVLALAAVFADSAAASENIRVAVADNQQRVVLKSAAGLVRSGEKASGREKRIVFQAAHFAQPVRYRSAGTFIEVNGKSYRGWIEIRRRQNGLLLVINDVDLEDYLRGVIAAEIPHDWAMEALKAQAVASRTYALYQKRSAGKKPYHILATVNGQVYSGKQGERETTVRAVLETQGQVITYQGTVIPAFYHSSCGGQTENAGELWSIDAPYLRGVDCECQSISQYGAWEKRLAPSVITSALRRQGYPLQDIRELAIHGITQAGRVKYVNIGHADGVTPVPAEKFRAALGYAVVPSLFFETELSGNEVVISGRGLGHGVGLCQWGAREMAQRGHDYRSILEHYYPGTQVENRGGR